jgi:hypothetical protein
MLATIKFRKFLSFHGLSKNPKIKIYKTIILLVACKCKTWSLRLGQESRLNEKCIQCLGHEKYEYIWKKPRGGPRCRRENNINTRNIGGNVWIGFNLHGIESNGGHMWIWQWTFRFHKTGKFLLCGAIDQLFKKYSTPRN